MTAVSDAGAQTPAAVGTLGAPPRRWPGLVAATAGLACALLAHWLLPSLGVLTWAVALGLVAGNARLLPAVASRALSLLTRRLLRVGIVLLGFSVSFGSIAALGLGTVAMVAGTLVATLIVTTWLGNRVGLGRARSLLVATGFAVCGASAIAAMEETAGADEEDVAVGVAMVTLFGTLAMVLLPLLWHPLHLTDVQFGVWTGAAVQEVGQVVAAAGAGGATVVGVAVVVKLTRVLLLAPVVATVSVRRRMVSGRANTDAKRPPVVPLFVLGFVACVALRSTGLIPSEVLGVISQLQVAALGAALFGMGAGVRLASLLRRSGPVLAVAAASTVFITGVSLGGVLLLGG